MEEYKSKSKHGFSENQWTYQWLLLSQKEVDAKFWDSKWVPLRGPVNEIRDHSLHNNVEFCRVSLSIGIPAFLLPVILGPILTGKLLPTNRIIQFCTTWLDCSISLSRQTTLCPYLIGVPIMIWNFGKTFPYFIKS